MSKYKIEKGIPMPPVSNSMGISSAFREMQIGDSIFVENKNTASAVSSREGAKIGAKFSIRKEGTGARVWRVA